jgi:hypothetical protein
VFVAVVDGKTSKTCEELNGKIFFVKDAEIGLNAPPMHPNCRSVIIPFDEADYDRSKDSASFDEWLKAYSRENYGVEYVLPDNERGGGLAGRHGGDGRGFGGRSAGADGDGRYKRDSDGRTVADRVMMNETPSGSELPDLRGLYNAGKRIYLYRHEILDILGFVPVAGDVVDLGNGMLYLVEGDIASAVFSGISMIPVAGDALGKGGRTASKIAAEYGDEALEAISEAVVRNEDEVVGGAGKRLTKTTAESVNTRLDTYLLESTHLSVPY